MASIAGHYGLAATPFFLMEYIPLRVAGDIVEIRRIVSSKRNYRNCLNKSIITSSSIKSVHIYGFEYFSNTKNAQKLHFSFDNKHIPERTVVMDIKTNRSQYI